MLGSRAMLSEFNVYWESIDNNEGFIELNCDKDEAWEAVQEAGAETFADMEELLAEKFGWKD